jgi:formamidopyrimidine-DNA glycosylase
MPELPEVETVVRDLRPLVVGRAVRAVTVGERRLRRPWHAAWAVEVVGRTIEARRRGKWILVDLSGGPRLVVHLGMTGQFTAGPAAAPRPDHLHMTFALAGDTELRFRDVRRFGSVEFAPDEATAAAALDARLGPEPDALDPAGFFAAVARSARPLKAILLDQTVVAGVGNIYADESLHAAKLHPERRGTSITRREADRLAAAVTEVIARAITFHGSTIRDYVGGSGLRGGFQDEFAAYGRTGDPCPRCGTAIERIRVAGRSSHFCPRCQQAPKAGA